MENINTAAQYMQRCITLAQYGAGNVSPNPMVGCVIVHNREIIGEGYHQKYGGAHAEVNAIASVKNLQLLQNSTMYVSLEPCSHYGKTPPCADLIIQNKIPKVYVGCIDPYPEVAGKGIQKLKAAGVEVVVGVCEKECTYVNRRFMTSVIKKRPYIILKWAETQDGYMGINEQSSTTNKTISDERNRFYVHRMRAQEDAILVGTNTALEDNPSLSIRYWFGNAPLRLVIDCDGKLPRHLHLFDNTQATVIYTTKSVEDQKEGAITQWVCLDGNKAILPQILDDLYQRKIRSLIVEGGQKLLQSFIDDHLYDEVHRYVGTMNFGSGIKAPSRIQPKIE